MRMGRKSLLFGGHQFILHPLMVFIAWWKLYGFPFDPRLWVAFLVHDCGYWSCDTLDGPDGKYHPLLGAAIMHLLFDEYSEWFWYDFTLCHSRSIAKVEGLPVSMLCRADKLATAITPAWLYLPMVMMTGEIEEFMEEARKAVAAGKKINHDLAMGAVMGNRRQWFRGLRAYLKEWVYSADRKAVVQY